MDPRNHAPVSADGKAVSAWREQPASAAEVSAARVPLAITLAIFALAFLLPAWPWLSGAVTIPWDAKSQFFPQVQFLAGSLARGEWPWWSPNVFAGWAADLRSAVAAVLAAACPARRVQPGGQPARIRCRDLRLSVSRRCRHHPVLSRPRLACRRGAGGGDGICARRFRPMRACSTPARSSAWPTCRSCSGSARALERSSWRAGLAAGALAGLMAIGRDQVALLSLYVLAGFVLAHWLTGAQPLARMRASIKPLAAVAASGRAGRRRADHDDHAAGGALEPARDRLRFRGRRLAPPRAPAAVRLRRSFRRDGPQRRILGAAKPRSGTPLGDGRDSTSRRIWAWSMPAR